MVALRTAVKRGGVSERQGLLKIKFGVLHLGWECTHRQCGQQT